MRWNLLAAVAVVALGGAVVIADDKKDEKKEDKKDAKTFDFPDLNAKEWKKLDSGMKVWDVKEGKGDEVKAGAKVKVNYTGWLTDGTPFDSSLLAEFKHVEPISFGLDGVIKGWTEGVPGMKPGGVRRLIIPPEMAYGKRARGKIPADATLVFVIEYLGPGDDK
jgi:FKBP-type peptidyl-prolyl cis-trans isomerase